MDESCPYCGKETSALKNHVRLAGGDGHGPNGSYPEDFFRVTGGDGSRVEATETEETETVGEDDPEPNSTPDDGGEETVELPPDGVDTAIEAAREEGYRDGTEDGFEAGYTTAEHELAAETCPECGEQLDTDVDGVGWIRHDGAVAELEDTEALCRSCDLVVPEEGDPIHGSHYGADPVRDGGGRGWLAAVGGAVLGLVGLAAVAIRGGDTGTENVFD